VFEAESVIRGVMKVVLWLGVEMGVQAETLKNRSGRAMRAAMPWVSWPI